MCMSWPVRAHLGLEWTRPHHAAAAAPAFASAMADLAAVPPQPCRRWLERTPPLRTAVAEEDPPPPPHHTGFARWRTWRRRRREGRAWGRSREATGAPLGGAAPPPHGEEVKGERGYGEEVSMM